MGLAHVTVEYMIMIPVLILQIFLFPIVAGVIMNSWDGSRRTLELQDTAGHLGSTIQQFYYTINHASIANGVMTINLDIPPLIEGLAYTVTLHEVTSVDTSCRVMNVTLHLIQFSGAATALVTLGNNVHWQDGLAFNSTSHPLILTASKNGGSIELAFGGGA